jgi:threonylcarbamoyladenosine tRNA methylthiotransferase MtaB
MKTFIIKTLGCKVNQCESEAIGNALSASDDGYTGSGDGSADVVIINTCTVTGKAAMQSRQAVRRAIREHPAAHIVVTGCHAQTTAKELSAIDGVDLIVGNAEKHRIPQLLACQTTPPPDLSRPALRCPDIAHSDRFEALPSISHGNRTRPFLKIQDGCNDFCTYCIVPYARGRSRSQSADDVLHQIRQLSRLGYREVVLTGIHIGCYGQDLIPATGLYDLLCRIREDGAIDRVRISSIEPVELSDDIIKLAASEDDHTGRLCPHFHIPLQSGDDAILRRMHRPYDGDYFKRLVRGIIERLPDAAIGVDTLIGFPGESDSAFEKTFGMIESLPIAYLHVFPFSARRGTPAFHFDDKVPEAQIKTRCRQMRRLGDDKRRAFYARYVGKTVTVLVEGARNRIDGRLKGLTNNYIPVRFHGSGDSVNTFRRVTIQCLSADGTPQGVMADSG